jgi:L-alanine-DL-glutamate epimerase-like enolase superfamily enzyme
VSAAVATGENLDHVSEFMPLITEEAVDIVQVGSGTAGITGALQVAGRKSPMPSICQYQ